MTFSGTSLGTVEGQEGVAVKTAKLRRAIRAELVLPHADRVVEVSTRVTQPEVTRDELASQIPGRRHGQPAELRAAAVEEPPALRRRTRSRSAQVGLDTPAGLYHIQNKAVNPAWTMPNSSWVAPADRGTVIPGGVPENPLKARWLGIYAGAGIHGTDAT